MKAVVITDRGGLEVHDVDPPVATGSSVVVRVHAAGLNRADLMQARGHYPAPPGEFPDRPGLEFAGEVAELPPSYSGHWATGDRVFGIVGAGGLAEYVAVHERMLAPIPANLDYESAAAVPEVFLTAHDALDTQANLRPGERVLIHAVGGGVGTAALQLAKAAGCLVFGTSRTAEKLDRCKSLGLDVAINTSEQDFAETVREHTAGAGVQIVIDHLGAAAWDGNLASLAVRGRLVLVGLLAGSRVQADLATLLRKRLTVVGTTLRARPLEEKIAVTQRFVDRVLPLFERKLIRPVLDRSYDLSDLHTALRRLDADEPFGKLVIRFT